MFTAALLTIAKVWKQPWCPLKDEWKWCMYAMEYDSAIEKKEILPSATTQMHHKGDCAE